MGSFAILIAGALLGCDDHVFSTSGGGAGGGGAGGGDGGGESDPGGTGAVDATGWCAAVAVLGGCGPCHGAESALGGLDLETDPHAAVVNAPSADGEATLVVPFDPDASLLYRKLAGTQGDQEGGPMPPTGPIAADRLEAVRAWIAAGADGVCEEAPTGDDPDLYHPEGWAAPSSHGLDAKLGRDDCRACHGPDLAGGDVGIACGSCHPQGWEQTCTFCHGDPTTGQPAPPEDIDDNADPATVSFPAHRIHLESPDHPPWGCDQCHVVPDSALAPGHLFDDATPGRAEIAFGGLSVAGRYADTTCSDLYCHGDGARDNGVVSVGADVGCGDCHATASTPDDWERLSGPHERHLDEDIDCAECHPNVSNDGRAVIDGALHVDGQPTIVLPAQVTYDGSCTGSCHGESHSGRNWVD